ncbi:PadR family transcriptional regulator [Natrinema thermotolerans]
MAQANPTPGQTAQDMTDFRWNALYVIAAEEPVMGLNIKTELEDYYGTEINHGRLYPNLDTLVDWGLVEKRERDKRTNEYLLTSRGEALLARKQGWESERFDTGGSA